MKRMLRPVRVPFWIAIPMWFVCGMGVGFIIHLIGSAI